MTECCIATLVKKPQKSHKRHTFVSQVPTSFPFLERPVVTAPSNLTEHSLVFTCCWIFCLCLFQKYPWAYMVELAVDPHFSQALRKGPNQPFLASLFSSKPACVPVHAELPEILCLGGTETHPRQSSLYRLANARSPHLWPFPDWNRLCRAGTFSWHCWSLYPAS